MTAGPRSPAAVGRRRAAFGASAGLLVGAAATCWMLLDPGARPDRLTAPPLAAVSSGPVPSSSPGPDEARGRWIYERGTGRSGQPVLAVLGDGVSVPAALLRCGNCHGEDGLGTEEGGVVTPDITWPALARPVGGRRPAYTEALVRRAIGSGLDAAGRPLRAPMPRYQMPMEDLDDLLAYMRRLGQAPPAVPGITPDRIRLGTLLPPPVVAPETSRAVRSILEDWAGRVNQSGLYGRRVEFTFLDLEEEPGRRAAQIDRLLREREPFALAWAFLDGAEAELAGLLGRPRVPVVGACTDLPPIADPPDRYLFYLDGGTRSEALAALSGPGGSSDPCRRLVVLSGGGPALDRLAGEVEARGRSVGLAAVERRELPTADRPDRYRALAEQLHERGMDTLCLLGPPERWLPLLESADRLGWRPRVVVPGSLANARVFDVPESFDDRIELTFSTGPAAGRRAERLARAVAVLLEEALRRAGRDLTRESLVDTLERFHDIPTGVLPPVSFGPNRRVGAPGATPARLRRASRTLVAAPWRPAPGE